MCYVYICICYICRYTHSAYLFLHHSVPVKSGLVFGQQQQRHRLRHSGGCSLGSAEWFASRYGSGGHLEPGRSRHGTISEDGDQVDSGERFLDLDGFGAKMRKTPKKTWGLVKLCRTHLNSRMVHHELTQWICGFIVPEILKFSKYDWKIGDPNHPIGGSPCFAMFAVASSLVLTISVQDFPKFGLNLLNSSFCWCHSLFFWTTYDSVGFVSLRSDPDPALRIRCPKGNSNGPIPLWSCAQLSSSNINGSSISMWMPSRCP